MLLHHFILRVWGMVSHVGCMQKEGDGEQCGWESISKGRREANWTQCSSFAVVKQRWTIKVCTILFFPKMSEVFTSVIWWHLYLHWLTTQMETNLSEIKIEKWAAICWFLPLPLFLHSPPPPFYAVTLPSLTFSSPFPALRMPCPLPFAFHQLAYVVDSFLFVLLSKEEHLL